MCVYDGSVSILDKMLNSFMNEFLICVPVFSFNWYLGNICLCSYLISIRIII